MDERLKKMDKQFDDLMRHNEMLFGSVRQDIRRLADILSLHEANHAENRAYFDEQFLALHTTIRQCIDQSRQRAESLERKQN